MAQDNNTTRWGRWGRTTMIIALTALIVAPVAAFGSNVFDDVPNSNIFHEDIAWMSTSGVTKGCNPPANDEFCPGENVTREQMAAFMHRFAQNVTTPNLVEVATADKAKSTSSTSFVDVAGATVDITVPAGRTALVVAEFTAESRCTDTDATIEWCSIQILANGSQMNPQFNTSDSATMEFAFDSTDEGSAPFGSWQAHAATRSVELGPGTHTIKVQWGVTDPTVTFWLDDLHLLVEANLQ